MYASSRHRSEWPQAETAPWIEPIRTGSGRGLDELTIDALRAGSLNRRGFPHQPCAARRSGGRGRGRRLPAARRKPAPRRGADGASERPRARDLRDAASRPRQRGGVAGPRRGSAAAEYVARGGVHRRGGRCLRQARHREARVADTNVGPPTQSPTTFAGLRRFATSLWLRSVALPQRVPVSDYRRRGSPVVNFIYRVPPRDRLLQHRRYPAAANSGEHPVAGQRTRENRHPRLMPFPRAPIHTAQHLHIQTTPSPKEFQAADSRAVLCGADVVVRFVQMITPAAYIGTSVSMVNRGTQTVRDKGRIPRSRAPRSG